MSGEFAGRLRERIVVEALSGARNEFGAILPDYEVVARCLAAVAPEGVGAEAEGQALTAMARFRVTIRVREGISVGQRVRWRERVLMVRQRIDDPALPDRITLRCEETRS